MRLSRRTSVAALAVAVTAAGALLFLSPHSGDPRPPSRAALGTVWPDAGRGEVSGNVPDGPVYQPGLFLDARTSIGTAATPDGASLRLLLRDADGTPRELRRLPLDKNPAFDHFVTAADEVVWTESVDDTPVAVWALNVRAGQPRRLTTDTGDPVFYGSQYDLVIAEGRVHWAAAAEPDTVIRSVALTGGPVRVRTEPGRWALSTWPWVIDGGGDQTGTTTLRDLTSNREIRVATSGTELTTCGPSWCRVIVVAGDGPTRIDVMRPSGADRRRVAGPAASAAVTDVAILDRFEILAEAGPDSDLTGAQGLVVYDIGTGRTVDVATAVTAVATRNGVLWWSTGDQDNLAWHTLDLRTI